MNDDSKKDSKVPQLQILILSRHLDDVTSPNARVGYSKNYADGWTNIFGNKDSTAIN